MMLLHDYSMLIWQYKKIFELEDNNIALTNILDECDIDEEIVDNALCQHRDRILSSIKVLLKARIESIATNAEKLIDMDNNTLSKMRTDFESFAHAEMMKRKHFRITDK